MSLTNSGTSSKLERQFEAACYTARWNPMDRRTNRRRIRNPRRFVLTNGKVLNALAEVSENTDGGCERSRKGTFSCEQRMATPWGTTRTRWVRLKLQNIQPQYVRPHLSFWKKGWAKASSGVKRSSDRSIALGLTTKDKLLKQPLLFGEKLHSDMF